MKTLSTRLFVSFMALIGIILAVLGIVIGQLFPVYIGEYLDRSIAAEERVLYDTLQQSDIILTEEDQKRLVTALIDVDTSALLDVAQDRFFVAMVFCSFVAFIIIGIVINRTVRIFTEPIENATRTALELAKGNYRARAFENGVSKTAQLSKSINILARNLQDMTTIREIEAERLKTLVENMGSSLMMIGREGTISIVNRVFLKRFNYAYDQVRGKGFRSIALPDDIVEVVEHVFLTETPIRKQVSVQIGHEIRQNEIYGAPVVGDHGRWLGVVLVIHDVTELMRLEQIRKDFVANVSHELRTPITSIKGFSETLLDGAYKDEAMLLSFLEIIYKESDRIQILVQELLELSKIEQHGFSVDITETSLRDIVINAADLTGAKLEEKNMEFAVDMPNDVIVAGDPNRLMQVFTNLIANAINYSLENTTVTIRVYEDEEDGIVEIQDEGIGIEAAEIPRIFERFYRVDRARSRNSGGTGLGLAIVKHLVEAHDGKIKVESEVGVGTKMIVRIPKS
ncbi:two-component system histidine kinase PnpS [Caryophanon latum]|uniref:histidine kinase n=1 Tax=Caryophanon latum TaxID=33977 RepID=A0A1C0Z0Q3_9BACL|nr:HAMP domain-containing sensor histidine kinase [Caryophanon latum]OCS93034.1 PAS domain-containing sensor histidine kinase [Caryophanon latum]